MKRGSEQCSIRLGGVSRVGVWIILFALLGWSLPAGRTSEGGGGAEVTQIVLGDQIQKGVRSAPGKLTDAAEDLLDLKVLRETITAAHVVRNRGPFTEFHEEALSWLFDLEFDRQEKKRYKIRLRTFDLEELQERKEGDETTYDTLLRIAGDLDIVIDNTWGSHLRESQSTIEREKVPVISLNADRSGLDYGDSVLFFGSNDVVPDKVCAFVRNSVLARRPENPDAPLPEEFQIIFANEEDYKLTRFYEKALSWYGLTAMPKFERVPFSREIFEENDDGQPLFPSKIVDEQTRVKQQIDSFLEPGEPAVVVINAHKEWGDVLVKHLEGRLDGRTVIVGHDTIVSGQARDDGFGASNSLVEMVLLKTPSPEMSELMFETYQYMLEEHRGLIQLPVERGAKWSWGNGSDGEDGEDRGEPKMEGIFPPEVARVFIRRCVVASEMISTIASEAPPAVDDWRGLFASRMAEIHEKAEPQAGDPPGASSFLGDLGYVHFNQHGEEDGSNLFQWYCYGKSLAHLNQLNSENDVIPALLIRVENVRLSRIDVETGVFEAEFDCSATISRSLKEQLLTKKAQEARAMENMPAPPPDSRGAGASLFGLESNEDSALEFFDDLLSIPNMRSENRSITEIDRDDDNDYGVDHRVYNVKGTFSTELDTLHYPHDRQDLVVEIKPTLRMGDLTITGLPSGAQDRKQIGWHILDVQTLYANKLRQQNPLQESSQMNVADQFKEFRFVVRVKRELMQPILIVMLPLVLMGGAAIGILFLSPKQTQGKSPSELAMGVVLGVVAYSISYAEVVPRSGGWTSSDILYLFTIFVVMGNFGAILLFGELKEMHKGERWRQRYSVFIAVTYITFFVLWLLGFGNTILDQFHIG